MYNLPVMKRTVPKLALVFALHCLNKFSLRVVSSLATELAKNEAPEQNQMGQLTKTRQHIIVVACNRQATQIFMHYSLTYRIGGISAKWSSLPTKTRTRKSSPRTYLMALASSHHPLIEIVAALN